MRQIKIGKSESKICATCEFWQGGTDLLKSKGYSNSPETMILDDSAKSTYAQCIKSSAKKSGTSSCSKHKLHYSLERYIKK